MVRPTSGDGNEAEPAESGDFGADVADELISLFEEAIEVLWEALDERDRRRPRDFADEQRWRWRLKDRFEGLIDDAQSCVEELRKLAAVPHKLDQLQRLLVEQVKAPAPDLASGKRSMRRPLKDRAQAMARFLFSKKPYPTIKAIMESTAFISAVNDRNSGAIPVPEKTLRSWISEVAPKEVKRGGRPPKQESVKPSR